MFTKILALVLSICMLITSAPFDGLAESIGNVIESISQKTADSVDGSVESLGQEAEDGKDFVVKEDVEDEEDVEIPVWDGSTTKEPTKDSTGKIYYIYTPAELAWLSQQLVANATESMFSGNTFRLMNDIDLGGYEWTPIGARDTNGGVASTHSFGGVFDGQYHKIYNLKITTDKLETGLFGYVRGKSDTARAAVRNVGIIDPIINVTNATPANYAVAALIGHSQYANIDRCYVRGGRVTANTAVAGLIGRIQQSNLTDSYVQGTDVILTTVAGSYTEDAEDGPFPRAGGLTSYCNAATTNITNCYSTANVTATSLGDDYESGIVGYCYVAMTVKNCYSEKVEPVLVINKVNPTVNSSTKVADGELKNYAATLGGAYTEDTKNINNGYPILVTELLADKDIPVWDGTTRTQPTYDSTTKTYYIYKPEELAWMSTRAYAGTSDAYKFKGYTILLMNDIDLGGHKFTPIGGRSSATAASTDYYFAGTFDGQYHKIYGLNVSGFSGGYIGLFGYTSGATIKKFGIINPVVAVTNDGNNTGTAVVVGRAVNTTIDNVFLREPEVTARYRAGGIVGYTVTTASTISNCYVQGGTITSTLSIASTSSGGSAAGIVACTNAATTKISNCYSTAVLSENNDGYDLTGAIIGRPGSNAASINNCYGENDDDIHGDPGSVTVDPLSAVVESGALKTYADTLGEAYITDTASYAGEYVNNGYPIFTWEHPEYWLNEFYDFETKTERKVEKNSDGVVELTGIPKEIYEGLKREGKEEFWTAYISAMDTVYDILNNTTVESYADIQAAYKNLEDAIENLYDAYYKSSEVVLPWNGTNTIDEKTAEPKETDTDGAILIYRAEELAYIASQVNAANTYSGKIIRLAKDIDLNGLEGDKKPWTPIGGNTGAVNGFAGTFDGNCKEISDLYIDSTDKYAVGLFGYVAKGTIKNVHMIKPNVTVARTTKGGSTDDNGVGALIGALAGTTVEHCFVRGGSVTSTYRAGGLIGSAVTNKSTVTNCYVQGTTVRTTDLAANSANPQYAVAGGIVGLTNIDNNTFNNCYSTAVTVADNTAADYTGGIIGRSVKATIVNNCYVENDNAIFGLSSGIPTVNYPSAVVAEGKLKTLASDLGAEYVYDTNKNNGYPIFPCEGTDRDIIRDAYLTEMDSEREAYKEDINFACPNEYKAYKEILDDAKEMLDETEPPTPDAQQELADRLAAAAEALKDAYDVSPFIVIPWDGNTIKEPIINGTNYYIYTAEQLAWFSYQVAKAAGTAYSGTTFHLMKNIDLGGVIGDANGEHTVVPTNAWTPIGGRTLAGKPDNNIFFASTFEGYGHIVKNMYIYETEAEINVGLFGGLPATATINELGVENAHVEATGVATGTNFAVGAMLGYANGATIKNCFVRNSTVTATQTRYMGGLVGTGHTSAPIISNCYVSDTTVDNKRAENYNYGPAVGGIIGYTYNAGVSIKNCYVAATLKNANTAGKFTGNIVGNMRTTFTNQVINTQCYAASGIEGNQATSLVGSTPTVTTGMQPTSWFITQEAITALGTAFAMDVNPNVNNQFPILYWEDPEYNLRNLYYAEKESERIKNDELISEIIKNYYDLYYLEYLTAYNKAAEIIEGNNTVDDLIAISNTYNELLATKEALYNAYYYNHDDTPEVLIPWNGTHQVDGVDAVPKTDASGHYLIYRAEELAYVSHNVSAGTAAANTYKGKTVKLMKDIDLNGGVNEDGTVKNNWMPIGGRTADGVYSSANYFAGTFDGQHHKIYGLKIDTDQYATGLFGYVYFGATTGTTTTIIKNFGIIDPDITVASPQVNTGVGVLVGYINYANVEHVFTRGGSVEANVLCSALLGRAQSKTKVNNCYVEGTEVTLTTLASEITKVDQYPRAVGLVAYPQASTEISNSYSTAVLSATNLGDDYTAGIIGVAHSTGTKITNCYSVGETLVLPVKTNPAASDPTIEKSAQVDAETLKSYATVLGSEYTFDYGADVNNGFINNGYPIFTCEEKEITLINFYFNQNDTEHGKYSDMISKACPKEWQAYQDAMNAIKALLDDDRVSDEVEVNAAIDNVNRVIDEVLYPAYHKSKDVIIPWNGTAMEPKYVEGNDYYIYRAEELKWIANNVNGGTAATNTMAGKTVHLMKDINLNDVEWAPIGGNGTTYFFRGHFDGHHHKIYGLKINNIKVAGAGLFGYVFGASTTDRASIKNFGVIEPEIDLTLTTTNTNHGVGAVVGSFYNTDMDHVFVRGGYVRSTNRTGALIGSTITGTQNVTNCYVVGTEVQSKNTTTTYASAGALSAYNNAGPTTFQNCYVADVTLKSGKNTTFNGVFLAYGNTENVVTINNCYYTTDDTAVGTASTTQKLDLFSKKVTAEELKALVPVLGSEYVYALSDAAVHNYGYPVFWCEYPEARVKALVENERVSERTTYEELITNGLGADNAAYVEYKAALKAAQDMIADDVVATNDEQTAVVDRLNAAITAYENAYNTSKAVILPWNGEIKMPETDVNGNYLIYRAEELAWVAAYVNSGDTLSGENFKIMKNLDLNGDEHNWIPIGGRTVEGAYSSSTNFAGNIDGQGNIITNMKIESNVSLNGLFGYVNGATIKNIGIEDSTVAESGSTTTHGTAILVANAYKTTIEACYVRDCTVSATNTPAAGLVGVVQTTASTIIDCYVQGTTVSSTSTTFAAAGILGRNAIAGTTITNCYSNATLESSQDMTYEGSMVGTVAAAITVTNSYGINTENGHATVTTTKPDYVNFEYLSAEDLKKVATKLGANFGDDFAGDASINAGYPILYWEDPEFELRKFYSNELASPRTTREDLMTKYQPQYGEYLAAMEIARRNSEDDVVLTQSQAQVVLENLKATIANLREAYDKDLDATIPWDGSAIEPELDGTTYKIYSAEELAWVSEAVEGGEFFTGKTVELQKDIDLAEIPWAPIGGHDATGAYSGSYYFRGIFDGKHNKIYGLKIENNLTMTGLFGYVYGAAVATTVIKNVGIIDPQVNSTGIANNNGTGALVGSLGSATVEHAFVRGGTVKGRRAGGVVGAIVSAAANVTNCYSQGMTITCIPAAESSSNTGANGSAGGVVGYNNQQNSKITSCYSASKTEVTGSKTVEAAVLGLSTQNMTLTNCYGVNDAEIAETGLYRRSVNTVTVDVKNAEGTTSLYPAATVKASASTIGDEFEIDYLEINAGYPIFWCENVFQDLVEKIEEGEPVLNGKYVDGTDVKYFAAILKYHPELIATLDTAITDAKNYLTADTTTDNSGMQTHIDNINAAIEAIKAADQEYINNPGSLEALNITVFAPPVLTLASDGTYATGQSVRIKSNYLITGDITKNLTLKGGNNTATNNVTLERVAKYTTEGEGDELLYVYTFNITGGTPEAAEEGEEQNTTVTFNATATSNGLTATAKASSRFILSSTQSTLISARFEGDVKDVETATMEIYYALGIYGLHEVGSDCNYEDTPESSTDGKVWNYDYNAADEDFKAVFYRDKNTSNKFAVANGATDINSIKYTFTSLDDGGSSPDDAALIFKVSNTGYFKYVSSGSYIVYDSKNDYLQVNILTKASGTKGTTSSNVNPTPSSEGVTVTYTLSASSYDKENHWLGSTDGTLNVIIDFDITYYGVDSTALWNLYSYETNKVNGGNRFEYKDLYEQANPEAWATYEAAYFNAAQVLMGGVPQGEVGTDDINTIEGAYKYLHDAVLGLGTLVKYDLNGGEGVVPESHNVPLYKGVTVSSINIEDPKYDFNDVYFTDLAPYDGITRTGYQCIGWSLKKDATEDDVSSGYLTLPNGAMSKAVTVYATWKPNTYTIKYNANTEASITGLPADQSATYGEVVTLSSQVPQISNHDFVGWNTRPDGTGDMYDAGAEVKNLTAEQNGTVTLYAIWKVSTTNIIFDLNLPEGVTQTTDGRTEPFTEALRIGENVDLTQYQLDAAGYRHLGWSTVKGASTTMGDTFSVPNTSTTLYAVWQKKAMTVKYSEADSVRLVQGGEYTKYNESVNCGDPVDLPTAEEIKNPGYTLAGWNASVADDNGKTFFEVGTNYIIPDSLETEVVFTAEWIKRQTTITLHHNNSTTEDVTSEIKGEFESVLDSDLFITPEKTDVMSGYTFTGWYVKDGTGYKLYAGANLEENPPLDKTFPAEDVELYAGWSMDALEGQLDAFDAIEIDGIGKNTKGEDVPYYMEPGKTTAKEKNATAETIYGTEGILYNWEEIATTNTATSELETAINALVPNGADYDNVEDYLEYYEQIIAGTHTFKEIYPDASKESFTEESFAAFKAAVDAVMDNKKVWEQADVDAYAAALEETYNNLEPAGANYKELDKWIAEAKLLNTIIGSEDEPNLDDVYTDTWGMLWYTEESLRDFLELAQAANDLPRDLTAFEQNQIDELVPALYELYEQLDPNPADFSKYHGDTDGDGIPDSYFNVYIKYDLERKEFVPVDQTYAQRAEDIATQTNVFTTEYVELVKDANSAVKALEGASLKDDQEEVNRAIDALGKLLAEPKYKQYELRFHSNYEPDDVIHSVKVSCIDPIKGLAPENPTREGYVFLGWYTTPEDTADEVGRKINFATTTEEMGIPDRDVYARWEKEKAEYTLDVSMVNSEVYVKFGETAETLQGNRYSSDKVLYGTKVVLRAVPNGQNREFMYWKDNRNRIVSYSETLEFTMEADRYLIAVYSEAFLPGTENGIYTVVFVDSILKTVISEQQVEAGKSAIEPKESDHSALKDSTISGTHNEYTFTGWNKDFSNVTGHMIIESVYVLSNELFTITTVINGKANPQKYRYNAPVTLTITEDDIPENMVFAGWSLDGETAVSYDMTYKFYAYKDMTVTALFSAEEVKEEVKVILDIRTEAAGQVNGKDTYNAEFMVTRTVPEDYVFVSSGLLLTQDANLGTNDNLTFEAHSVENQTAIRLYRTVHTGNDGQYQLTVKTYSENNFYARGFVVYMNTTTGEIVTLYTEVQKASASNDEESSSD